MLTGEAVVGPYPVPCDGGLVRETELRPIIPGALLIDIEDDVEALAGARGTEWSDEVRASMWLFGRSPNLGKSN